MKINFWSDDSQNNWFESLEAKLKLHSIKIDVAILKKDRIFVGLPQGSKT